MSYCGRISIMLEALQNWCNLIGEKIQTEFIKHEKFLRNSKDFPRRLKSFLRFGKSRSF